MTATASRIVYRHRLVGGSAGCPGCAAGLPLNLAERELITGRRLTQYDPATWLSFCVDCLADLPRDGYEALFHVCGEEPPVEPGPVPGVQAEEQPGEPQPEPAVTVPRVKAGDVVRYHGTLTEYHGIWDVTVRDRNRLRLYRPFEALWNVSPDDVTVVQTMAQRNRLRRKAGMEPIDPQREGTKRLRR
jgi:hypothetical protein